MKKTLHIERKDHVVKPRFTSAFKFYEMDPCANLSHVRTIISFQNFPLQGCQTIFFCATEDESKLESGKFYRNEKMSTEIEQFLDKFPRDKITRLWDLSMQQIGDFL